MELRTALEGLGPDFDQSLRVIVAHFKAQIGTIHTLGADGMLHMRAHTPGIPEPVLAATQVIPIGKGIAGLAVERKAPVNLCNLQKDLGGVAKEGARRGIRANIICPGLVDTPLGRHTSAGRPSRSAAGVPFGRMATGWEIAYAALFFMSEESVYINAQTLAVDSGITGL